MNMKRWQSASFSVFLFLAVLIVLGSLACGSGDHQGINVAQTSPTGTPTQTPDPCAGVSDKMITDAIYGQLVIAGIGPQIFQINITSKGGVVTVYGWAAPKDVHDQVVDIVTKTSCVVKVDTTNFYDDPTNPTRPAPGCAEGFKRCGDICIPNSDTCIFNYKGTGNTNTAQSKPVSNTNTNGY